MKTIQITITTELASLIETLRDIFQPEMTTGEFLEQYAYWLFEDGILPHKVIEDASDMIFESEAELHGVARRVQAHVGKKYLPKYGWESHKNGKHCFIPLTNKSAEEIFDVCAERGYLFEDFRELVRLFWVKAGNVLKKRPQPISDFIPEALAALEAKQAARACCLIHQPTSPVMRQQWPWRGFLVSIPAAATLARQELHAGLD